MEHSTEARLRLKLLDLIGKIDGSIFTPLPYASQDRGWNMLGMSTNSLRPIRNGRLANEYGVRVVPTVIIDGDVKIEGRPDGRQPRKSIFTMVARKDGKWLIDAAQNTNIPSDYSQ